MTNSHKQSAPERILLVGDEPQPFTAMAEFLAGQGTAVRRTGDGREALAALQEEEFQVALLDLALPGTSGLELLSWIKTISPRTEVILFSTGEEALGGALQALRLGAYDYLPGSKMTLDHLQAVVARALERQRLNLGFTLDLVANLRQAQEELSLRRSQDLHQVRSIGEALAVPRTWEQLIQSLVNLLWENLSFKILGLQFQEAGKRAPWEAYRRQPGLKEDAVAGFKANLRRSFQLAAAGAPQTSGEPLPDQSLSQILWGQAQTGECLALVAGARDNPFSPEEAELFQIFILQGEAALRNLDLLEEIKKLAIRDGLTGLYNYRHFWEELVHEIMKSRRYQVPLSMLFLDLDNFKVINDTLGHLQGDMVLKTLGAYLQNGLRQADLACRYGGEEFVVLLPETGLKQALRVAERLRHQVSSMTISLPGRDLQVTVSIGVAHLTPLMDGEALVAAADAAMYRAKQAGKNRVCGPEPAPAREEPGRRRRGKRT
ncbi:MAG: diguanylate cyclase [Desulfobaccales bacterium]